MILTTLVPWLFQGLIFFYFGFFVGSMYLLASIFGISILESQNYFSHYGLGNHLIGNLRKMVVMISSTCQKLLQSFMESSRTSFRSGHLIGQNFTF